MSVLAEAVPEALAVLVSAVLSAFAGAAEETTDALETTVPLPELTGAAAFGFFASGVLPGLPGTDGETFDALTGSGALLAFVKAAAGAFDVLALSWTLPEFTGVLEAFVALAAGALPAFAEALPEALAGALVLSVTLPLVLGVVPEALAFSGALPEPAGALPEFFDALAASGVLPVVIRAVPGSFGALAFSGVLPVLPADVLLCS